MVGQLLEKRENGRPAIDPVVIDGATVSELVQGYGMRRTRCGGLAKIGLAKI